MNLTERQYERIARRLDGEAVALLADEQAVCDEIAGDEARLVPALAVPDGPSRGGLRRAEILAQIGLQENLLGEMLDVDVPPAAMGRAWRRTQVALARPQRMLLRVGAVAASVAVAAGVLLTLTLIGRQPGGPVASTPPASRSVPADVYLASVSAAQDPAINLLAVEIDQLEADVLASALPASVDIGLDQAERTIEEFWLDDVLVE